MFGPTNDNKTSYPKMFLQQPNLFICQEPCKALRAKWDAPSPELELSAKNSTVAKTGGKGSQNLRSSQVDWPAQA